MSNTEFVPVVPSARPVGGMNMTRRLVTVIFLGVVASGLVPAGAFAGAEQQCMMCHDFTTGENRIGPSLKGILGRKAGTYPGYDYEFTKYIKGEPWVWTEEKIREWDNNSERAVKKFTGNPLARTRMPVLSRSGLEEDNIISYIRLTSAGFSPKGSGNITCKTCHDFTTGENRIGPSLKGILGRKAGTYPGYKYRFTKYIKGEPWVWTEEKIRKWDNDSEKAIKEFTGNPDAKTLMPPQHRTGSAEDEIISFIKITSEVGK